MNRLVPLLVPILCLLPACDGCGGGNAPTSLVEYVPDSALGVLVLNSQQAVEQIRTLTPFDQHGDRWNEMGDDVDEFLVDTVGVGLTGAKRAVVWMDDDGWAALVEGDFDGDVDGEDLAGVEVTALARGVLLGIHDGRLLIGSDEGITAMMGVIEDDDTSLEDSDDERAEALTDVLRGVGGETFALAAVADNLNRDLPFAPIHVIGVGGASDRLVVRARFDDDDDADDAADDLAELIEDALGELEDEADRLKDRGRDPGEVIPAIFALHGTQLFVEELLDIETDGADVVATLELPGLGMTLPLVGMTAGMAVPAFLTAQRRAATTDATENVRALYDASVAHSGGAQGQFERAQVREAEVEVEQVRGFVEMYRIMHNGLPGALSDLEREVNGLGAITQGVPNDPWGNPYVYDQTSEDAFTLFSVGPDGVSGTEDDIHSSQW